MARGFAGEGWDCDLGLREKGGKLYQALSGGGVVKTSLQIFERWENVGGIVVNQIG